MRADPGSGKTSRIIGTRQAQSIKRVKNLMGLEAPDISRTDRYGMGASRTLDDWWAFCRLDPKNKRSGSAEFFCRD